VIIVTTKLTLDGFPHSQRINDTAIKAASSQELNKDCPILLPEDYFETVLVTLILQLVVFVLSAIDPHEENGTEYRQN